MVLPVRPLYDIQAPTTASALAAQNERYTAAESSTVAVRWQKVVLMCTNTLRCTSHYKNGSQAQLIPHKFLKVSKGVAPLPIWTNGTGSGCRWRFNFQVFLSSQVFSWSSQAKVPESPSKWPKLAPYIPFSNPINQSKSRITGATMSGPKKFEIPSKILTPSQSKCCNQLYHVYRSCYKPPWERQCRQVAVEPLGSGTAAANGRTAIRASRVYRSGFQAVPYTEAISRRRSRPSNIYHH